MRYLLTCLILFFYSEQAHAQLSIEHSSFKVNNLGQIVTIAPDGVDLYSANGELIQHYSEDLLGRPSSIDRSSSLESLIFYEDIPGFQLMDNTISPHAQVYDLNRADMQNVRAVSMSNDQTFWGYDAVFLELIRFDEEFNIVDRSGNLATQIGHEVDFVSSHISGRFLFLVDPERGVYKFDLFSTFLSYIPSTGIIDVDITEKFIYIADKEKVSRYDKRGISEDVWEYDNSLSSFDVELGKLYWGDGKMIHVESLNSLFD